MQEKEIKGMEEKDCMSFEAFAICVKMDIQKILGKEFKVKLEDAIKNNDTLLKAVIISKEGNNVSPALYLNPHYLQYVAGKLGVKDVVADLLDVYANSGSPSNIDISFLLDWRRAKEKVIFKLVNCEQNQKLLKDTIYLKWLDLALVPYIFLNEGGAQNAMILIKKHLLAEWKIDEEELFATAMVNTPKLLKPNINSMKSFLEQTRPDMDLDDGVRIAMERPENFLYILSGENQANGAVCMVYLDVLKEFADKIGQDLYILPSSIHEVILLPMTTEDDVDYLAQMVRDVNNTQVEPEEILSFSVYKYIRAQNKVVIVKEGSAL